MKTNSIISRSRFNPSRGGHGPGDVRDAFEEAVGAFEFWVEDTPEPAIEVRGRSVPISGVCGLVWNCTDVMPSSMCRELEALGIDMPQGSTYARGARGLKRLIAQ